MGAYVVWGPVTSTRLSIPLYIVLYGTEGHDWNRSRPRARFWPGTAAVWLLRLEAVGMLSTAVASTVLGFHGGLALVPLEPSSVEHGFAFLTPLPTLFVVHTL
jgi:hypothetical protein